MLFGQSMPKGSQRARLSDAGLAHERDTLACLGGVEQFVEQGLFAGRQPQVRVIDLRVSGDREHADRRIVNGQIAAS